MFIIEDWMGNRIAPSMEFDSLESGWDYILGELSDELGLTEEDFQEYYVVEQRDAKTYNFLDPNDPRAR